MHSDGMENDRPNPSGMSEREISLKYEIEGNKYKVGDNVTIRYVVSNHSQQEIYLITEVDEPTLLSHIDRSRSTPYLNNDLHIMVRKSQVPSEDIEFPKLEKLDPGRHYQGDISLTIGPFYTQGHSFLVYLSVFYLSREDMNTIRNLLKETEPEKMGLYLQDLEKTLTDEPIKISIVE